MFIRDSIISLVIGILVLLAFSRLIGRVQFSFTTSFWCAFIGQVFSSVIGFVTGILFSEHLSAALIISLIITFTFQTVLYQLVVRAKNGTLTRSRAAILSLLVCLSGFFVASPLIELWEKIRA